MYETNIIFVQAMWYNGCNGVESQHLSNKLTDIRQRVSVIDVGKTFMANDTVNFRLGLALYLGVPRHHQEECSYGTNSL